MKKVTLQEIVIYCCSVCLWLWVYIFATPWTSLQCPDGENCNITVSVQLYNSYSWSLSFNSWTSNWALSWGNIRVGQANILIDISANTGSSYMIYWGQSTQHWFWTWSYTNTQTINIGGEWAHSIGAEFDRSWEFLFSNTIQLYADYTPPSTPISNGIIDNSIFTDGTGLISWTDSIDSGIWLAWYYLYISMNPSFTGIIPLWTTWNSWSFTSDDLPKGTVFYKIIAIDFLGHESTSSTHYFHNQVPTYVHGGDYTKLSTYEQYNNTQIDNPAKSDNDPSTITHSVSDITSQTPKKIFNNQNQSLKLYLIQNFLENPVNDWVLPDVMPDTGVRRDELTPLSSKEIKAMLDDKNQFYQYLIYFGLAILPFIILLYLVFLRKKKRTTKHN